LLAGEVANDDHEDIGKPDRVGQGGHHLEKGARGNGGQVRTGPDMKDYVGQGGEDEGDFFAKRLHEGIKE
jgi:hypothetical protein